MHLICHKDMKCCTNYFMFLTLFKYFIYNDIVIFIRVLSQNSEKLNNYVITYYHVFRHVSHICDEINVIPRQTTHDGLHGDFHLSSILFFSFIKSVLFIYYV